MLLLCPVTAAAAAQVVLLPSVAAAMQHRTVVSCMASVRTLVRARVAAEPLVRARSTVSVSATVCMFHSVRNPAVSTRNSSRLVTFYEIVFI